MSFHLLRTVFWLIPAITVYTIALGSLSLASTALGGHGHFAHRCAQWWSWLILATTGVRVRVEGLDRLTPGATYVFVANHQSIYDIPVIFGSLPYQLRIIAKESLGRFPFLGWHLRRTGHMLVDRRRPDRAAIFAWARSLPSRGLCLIVFPEGTRSRDGRLAPLKGGAFHLAASLAAPLQPVAIFGTCDVMPKGSWVPAGRGARGSSRVRLRIGAPIATAGLTGGPARKALAEQVRAALLALGLESTAGPASDASSAAANQPT